MPMYKYDGATALVSAAPRAGFYTTAAVETFAGTGADEEFWGGEGDRLVGGGGDDTYYLQGFNIQIVEAAGGGIDTVVGWQSLDLSRLPEVENVRVANDGLYAAGNAKDNVVEGGAGAQQLYGGHGQDVLVGGAGADVFIVYKGEGNDVVQDFNPAEDLLRLKAGFTSFAELQPRLAQVGADVRLDLGDGDGLIFRNLSVGQLGAGNFQLELDPARLGAKTFADEFAGPLSLWDRESNPAGTWRPDYGYQGSQGVGSYTLVSNDEKQIYTSPYFRDHAGDFADSPFVSNADGTLSIWARPSANPEIFGYGYTSGLMTTKESHAQTYGYFEMRVDLPSGAGAWPAFWLLPADGSWPPELDVMEVLAQDPNATWTTAHSNATGAHTSKGIASYTPGGAEGFHTYGVLWTPSELAWYVDGVQVFAQATPADMNKPMFMLANLALGGWAGNVDGSALPAEMKIDYIRAYALGDGGGTPTPPAPPYQNTLFTLAETGAWTRTLTGGAKQDSLTGDARNELIDGKGNTDTMTGRGGDDTYMVDRESDRVVEAAGGGVDEVISTSASYTLSAQVENLTLAGTFGQKGFGNELGNRLEANDFGSTLSGAAGGDILVGGRGADVLTGGAGRDIFRFEELSGTSDRITDFTRGEDMLDLRPLFAQAGYAGSDPVADGWLQLRANAGGGAGVWFDVDGGAGPAAPVLVVTLDGVSPVGLTAQNDWFFL
ncbi:family 16 glycosylhydrolase [Phenylobacterium sp.]|uniref:family 16 glycosylhydrolase n=1 Tax=Phenylobacterium sp. TaxID=1871053 RepID=UPI0035B49AC4